MGRTGKEKETEDDTVCVCVCVRMRTRTDSQPSGSPGSRCGHHHRSSSSVYSFQSRAPFRRVVRAPESAYVIGSLGPPPPPPFCRKGRVGPWTALHSSLNVKMVLDRLKTVVASSTGVLVSRQTLALAGSFPGRRHPVQQETDQQTSTRSTPLESADLPSSPGWLPFA